MVACGVTLHQVRAILAFIINDKRPMLFGKRFSGVLLIWQMQSLARSQKQRQKHHTQQGNDRF